LDGRVAKDSGILFEALDEPGDIVWLGPAIARARGVIGTLLRLPGVMIVIDCFGRAIRTDLGWVHLM
jgi:hypothetical protein